MIALLNSMMILKRIIYKKEGEGIIIKEGIVSHSRRLDRKDRV